MAPNHGVATLLNDTLSNSGNGPPPPHNLSSADDPGRLLRCWIRQGCVACLDRDANNECGWCASSSVCLPLPSTPHLPSILAPLRHDDICPAEGDRFELRTAMLGCDVSTASVMSFFVGAASLLAVYGVLLVIVGIVAGLWRCFRAARGGWEIRVAQDGSGRVVEGVWVRKRQRWWRKTRDVDVVVIDDDGGEDGFWSRWTPWKGGREEGERRPLLSG